MTDDRSDGDDPFEALHDDFEAELFEEPAERDEVSAEGEAPPVEGEESAVGEGDVRNPELAPVIDIATGRPVGDEADDDASAKPSGPGLMNLFGAIAREVGRAVLREVQRKLAEDSETEAETIPIPDRAPSEAGAEDATKDPSDEDATAEIIDLASERRQRDIATRAEALGDVLVRSIARYLASADIPHEKGEDGVVRFELDIDALRAHGPALLVHVLKAITAAPNPPPEPDPFADARIDLDIRSLLDRLFSLAEDRSDPPSNAT